MPDINHLRIRIVSVRQETPLASTYLIENVSGEPVLYKAGQFITLLLNIDGKEARRSYSFSSTPGVNKHAAFTVQRVTNGFVSRYLLDHLQPGDVLECLTASGKFVVTDADKPFCFIAAGSGITPVFSLVKWLLNFSNAPIVLICQNRNELLSIFHDELLQLQKQYAHRLELIELFSQPMNPFVRPARLNNHLLERLLLQHLPAGENYYYLCGPIAFMRMAEFTLRLMGVSPGAIRKEIFEPPRPPLAPLFIDAGEQQVVIHHGEKVYRYSTQYPDSILQSALLNDIQLPFSCMGGRCSTCALQLVSGKIHMTMNEVLTEKDIADGLVLTCVGYALTDVELRLPAPGE